jgi:predicted MPP superfamily phosphohydrolase
MNIVLISDLHLGDVNSERHLERVAQKINSLNPDIVCIVGDIFNDDFYTIRDPGRTSELLENIEATYGVFASLGNHDGNMAGTLNQMMDFLEQSNVELLNCEHIIIDERLILIGRLDASPIGGFGEMSRKDFADILAQIEAESLPIVVMDHNPANISEYCENIDLILAGHTHGGQIFPGNLIVRAFHTARHGHYQINEGNTHVVVTQGAGTWLMPLRVGTDNEVVKLLLHKK